MKVNTYVILDCALQLYPNRHVTPPRPGAGESCLQLWPTSTATSPCSIVTWGLAPGLGCQRNNPTSHQESLGSCPISNQPSAVTPPSTGCIRVPTICWGSLAPVTLPPTGRVPGPNPGWGQCGGPSHLPGRLVQAGRCSDPPPAKRAWGLHHGSDPWVLRPRLTPEGS